MGFNPRADWIHATSPIPKVTLHLEQLKEARIQARDAMIKAQQSWVKHHDTPKYKECHGSAGTPLRTNADGEVAGLEESRPAIRT
jgi:hypothetical protein